MTDVALPGDLRAPGLARRMACFLYEGVLLFGVIMVAGLLYGVLTEQRHALSGARGLQFSLFVVLGVYFVWFWSRHGQTLAMRTWHVRLLTTSGRPLGAGRALCRYLLAWVWFVPGLLVLKVVGLSGSAPAMATIAVGVLVYATLSQLRSDRQFWHDVLCGTRLVSWRAAKPG
jgi:uncharacterized RDD family membrane protein YckC